MLWDVQKSFHKAHGIGKIEQQKETKYSARLGDSEQSSEVRSLRIYPEWICHSAVAAGPTRVHSILDYESIPGASGKCWGDSALRAHGQHDLLQYLMWSLLKVALAPH